MSAGKKHAPKWRHALSVFFLLGSSVVLCWLAIEVLAWCVGSFERGRDNWLLYGVGIFILWSFCFATVSELLHSWWMHRRREL